MSRFHEIGEEAAPHFQALGCRRDRRFFPHRLYYLPQAGPDALRLARWHRVAYRPDQLWQILLVARGPTVDRFPASLWTDDDIVWHRQHYGLTGPVAYAAVALAGRDLYVLGGVSDLVQRVARRREWRTAVERTFGGWPLLLWNGVMSFARGRGCRRVLSPDADRALTWTDPTRQVGRELFERVYDRAVTRAWRAERRGGWWVIDLDANEDRIVPPRAASEPLGDGKVVCVAHDIEHHWGHVTTDPAFAETARVDSPRHLQQMLAAEHAAGVRATYNVVGRLLPEVRTAIEADGHALGFHSYDHGRRNQLPRCRALDYRIAGYRPPQSRLTWELRATNLCRFNVQWLASSQASLRTGLPVVRRRVTRIPILTDDYALFRRLLGYREWEDALLAAVERADFVAVSLHDCYGDLWLPDYGRLLDRLQNLGTPLTFDQVAWRLALASGA